MYKIKKLDEKTYELSFEFTKQKCKVSVALENENTLYINCETDGYHWLEFFMCQEPNTKEMFDGHYLEQKDRVVKVFESVNWHYIPEDKETAFLSLPRNFKEDDLVTLAELMEPRFANRERFFEN